MMKKILVLVVATFMCSGLFAQGIEFEHGTFNEALTKAKKENKLIFMDCYTTWCGPCKHLAKNIFTQKEVGDFYNKEFVNVKMDCEKGEGPAIASKYGVSSYPTLLFIDGEGKAVHKLVGGMPAEQLIAGGKAALDPSKRIGTLKAKYESGNRDLEFLMTYLKAVKAQYDEATMKVVSREIINKTSLEKYMNKEQFFVIAAAAYEYGTKEFSYLLENKAKVNEMADEYTAGMLYAAPLYTHLGEYATKCKSLADLDAEVMKCHKLFPLDPIEATKKRMVYSYYIANNQLQKWYDEKIKEVKARKGDDNYVYIFNSICDEILRSPKLSASNEIVDQFFKEAKEIAADEKIGLIMGNLMLAKIYLYKKNKADAAKCFDIFFTENGKAGGNNTHPSVSNLKAAIDQL